MILLVSLKIVDSRERLESCDAGVTPAITGGFRLHSVQSHSDCRIPGAFAKRVCLAGHLSRKFRLVRKNPHCTALSIKIGTKKRLVPKRIWYQKCLSQSEHAERNIASSASRIKMILLLLSRPFAHVPWPKHKLCSGGGGRGPMKQSHHYGQTHTDKKPCFLD